MHVVMILRRTEIMAHVVLKRVPLRLSAWNSRKGDTASFGPPKCGRALHIGIGDFVKISYMLQAARCVFPRVAVDLGFRARTNKEMEGNSSQISDPHIFTPYDPCMFGHSIVEILYDLLIWW